MRSRSCRRSLEHIARRDWSSSNVALQPIDAKLDLLVQVPGMVTGARLFGHCSHVEVVSGSTDQHDNGIARHLFERLVDKAKDIVLLIVCGHMTCGLEH